MGRAFVSDPAAISSDLVSVVSRRASQVTTILRECAAGEQCHWSVDPRLPIHRKPRPIYAVAALQSRPRKKVKLNSTRPTKVSPVTAKHNLVPEDEDDRYARTMIQFPETSPKEITMPDGGCKITEYIEVRSATEETKIPATYRRQQLFVWRKCVNMRESNLEEDAVSLPMRPSNH
jgi:hypothetical protein